MTVVRIRNVEGWVVESLRARARSNGRSLESELRELLREEAMRPEKELAGKLRRMRGEMREKHGTLSDSVALLREVQAFFSDAAPREVVLSDELSRDRRAEAAREDRD